MSIPWSCTSGFQNHETSNFCHVKSLSLGYFVSTTLVIHFRPLGGSLRLELSCPAMTSGHREAFVCFPDPKQGQPGLFLACLKRVSEPMNALESWRCDFTLSGWPNPLRSRSVNESFVQYGSVSQGGPGRKPESEAYFLVSFLWHLEAAP